MYASPVGRPSAVNVNTIDSGPPSRGTPSRNAATSAAVALKGSPRRRRQWPRGRVSSRILRTASRSGMLASKILFWGRGVGGGGGGAVARACGVRTCRELEMLA